MRHSDKSAKVLRPYQYNYNKELSLQRAKIIESWLLENRIDSSRISVSSQGVESPVVRNDDISGNELNRRVEFIFRNEKE